MAYKYNPILKSKANYKFKADFNWKCKRKWKFSITSSSEYSAFTSQRDCANIMTGADIMTLVL